MSYVDCRCGPTRQVRREPVVKAAERARANLADAARAPRDRIRLFLGGAGRTGSRLKRQRRREWLSSKPLRWRFTDTR